MARRHQLQPLRRKTTSFLLRLFRLFISSTSTIKKSCFLVLLTSLHLSMSFTGSPAKRVELHEQNFLDCPGERCDGWLRIFADPAAPDRPNFVRCSTEVGGICPPTCDVKVMFSKFESICSSCSRVIKKHAIIASSRQRNVWVHAACYSGVTATFSNCQRCRKVINSEADAVPSSCSGSQGYRHRECFPKLKRTICRDDDDRHDDDDVIDSQDSLASTQSNDATLATSITPPMKRNQRF